MLKATESVRKKRRQWKVWEKRGRQPNVCEKEGETTEGVRRKEATESV